MKKSKLTSSVALLVVAAIAGFAVAQVSGRGPAGMPAAAATSSPTAAEPPQIQPEELAKILKSGQEPKPLILQVGFRVLYVQAHIPGAEYVGPASSAEGLRELRERVRSLPHTRAIVLYCGCCPWNRCPNVLPAYKELHALGFKNVKLLYIAQDFGRDWVQKGYPVVRGQE